MFLNKPNKKKVFKKEKRHQKIYNFSKFASYFMETNKSSPNIKQI